MKLIEYFFGESKPETEQPNREYGEAPCVMTTFERLHRLGLLNDDDIAGFKATNPSLGDQIDAVMKSLKDPSTETASIPMPAAA